MTHCAAWPGTSSPRNVPATPPSNRSGPRGLTPPGWCGQPGVGRAEALFCGEPQGHGINQVDVAAHQLGKGRLGIVVGEFPHQVHVVRVCHLPIIHYPRPAAELDIYFLRLFAPCGFPQFQAKSDGQRRFTFTQVPTGVHNVTLVTPFTDKNGNGGWSEMPLQSVTIRTGETTPVTIDTANLHLPGFGLRRPGIGGNN